MHHLVGLTALRQFCRKLGVARIDAGPQAIAFTFRPGAAGKLPLEALMASSRETLRWSGERLILDVSEERAEERQRHILNLLERLES
jgi:transcription-repair coupling factor (superfamily II helicase)